MGIYEMRKKVTKKEINEAYKRREKLAERAYELIAVLEGMEITDENSGLNDPKESRERQRELQNIQKSLMYYYL